MARTKLEDIISYILSQGNTNGNFDIVRYTDADSRPIPVKTYGMHVHINPSEFFESVQEHIGPFATENWKINVDVIINRRMDDRDSVSDSLGISYWVDTMRALFQNGTNSGKFKNSWWEFEEEDPSNDIYVVKGVLNVEILNNYS